MLRMSKRMLKQEIVAGPERSGDPAPPPKKNWALATIVLLAEVAFAVMEGQFGAIGFKAEGYNFNAPFFYTLCRFISRSLAFPVVLVGFWLFSLVTGKEFNLRAFWKHCTSISGVEGLTWRNLFRKYTLPTITAVGTGVAYIVALKYVDPSVTSACFSSTVAMSYILSIVFLKQKHLIVKTTFVIVSFAGVTMVAYDTTRVKSVNSEIFDVPGFDTFLNTTSDPNGTYSSTTPGSTEPLVGNQAYIGVISVLISCVALSFHQLFYTKSFPHADPYQAAFTVTIMFGISALIYWPVPLATKMLGSEVWTWDGIPWGYLMGGILSSLGVAFLYAFGLAISSPFFISLGELLNLAISAVVDYFRLGTIGTLQIIGSVVIGIAFLALLVPDEKLSVNCGWMGRRWNTFRRTGTLIVSTHNESSINLVSASQSTASLGPAPPYDSVTRRRSLFPQTNPSGDGLA